MSSPILDKFRLTQQISDDLFQFYSLEELEKLACLIRARRAIANKAFWAASNKKTGKTLEQCQQDLNENEEVVKEVTNDLSWLA